MRTRHFIALAAAAAALAALATASSGAGFPTLYVNYTMNCTFTMSDDSGKAVTSIAPGEYQVAVSSPAAFGGVDLSGKFDMTACKGNVQFKLTGPGVDLETTLDDGDGSYAMLRGSFAASSTYTAVDNNQPSVARATFTTTATASSGSSTGSTASTGSTGSSAGSSGSGTTSAGTGVQSGVVIGTLVATVAPTGKLTLTLKGVAVKKIAAGKYKVTVTDKSTKSGLYLRKAGAKTLVVAAAPFVGKHTVTVNLVAGPWSYSAGATGAATPFTAAQPVG